jgi:hypothetical protein
VATLDELRERSGTLFTDLLRAQADGPQDEARAAPDAATSGAFSWFNAEDAIASAVLSLQLSALAASGDTVEAGLSAALDHAEQEGNTARPEHVQIALALFVTHNRDGRRLSKPRTVAAAPQLFSPPRASGRHPAISVGGASPGLDYWREDVLANEHHQHWHEVYPYTGVPPASFAEWLQSHTLDDLIEIMETLAPGQPWRDRITAATPAQQADLLGQVINAEQVPLFPREVYAKLFRLNDRQGELFFYMHEQMLARYDAELLSHGLPRVAPFGPDDWDAPIAAGHDPIEVQGFGRREPDVALPADAVATLRELWQQIEDALADKQLTGLGGELVPFDRTNFGEAVEATVPQLRALAEDAYGGLHNTGHGVLARLAAPVRGVMRSTVTAIRDPVFWQWHKGIDDFNARWQEQLEPYRFDDAPAVLVRNAFAGADTPWSSPDIILCQTVDLPDGTDPAELGTQLFGGERWDTDFAAAEAAANGATLRTIDTLTTNMGSANFGGSRIRFLTHEPFSYFLRLENTTADALGVTVRVFLVPADQAEKRGMWMEMDKFLVELAPGRHVVYRPDTESSIIKRPAETSPAAVSAGGVDPDERAYCDCGWPYTLLLPRGTTDGMAFRLLVLCTDAAIDGMQAPEHCGSMSYCGAVDRYPDTRDMGYPFCRPFAGPEDSAIADQIVALSSAAARRVTIRHIP